MSDAWTGAEEDFPELFQPTLMAGGSRFHLPTHSAENRRGSSQIRSLFLAGCVLAAGAVAFGELATEPRARESHLSIGGPRQSSTSSAACSTVRPAK